MRLTRIVCLYMIGFCFLFISGYFIRSNHFSELLPTPYFLHRTVIFSLLLPTSWNVLNLI
jgi:hypothetical protein